MHELLLPKKLFIQRSKHGCGCDSHMYLGSLSLGDYGPACTHVSHRNSIVPENMNLWSAGFAAAFGSIGGSQSAEHSNTRHGYNQIACTHLPPPLPFPHTHTTPHLHLWTLCSCSFSPFVCLMRPSPPPAPSVSSLCPLFAITAPKFTSLFLLLPLIQSACSLLLQHICHHTYYSPLHCQRFQTACCYNSCTTVVDLCMMFVLTLLLRIRS